MKIRCTELPKPTYTPPFFDQLSERSQPLCGTLIIDRSTNGKIVVTHQRVWLQIQTQSFYEEGVTFCLGLLGLRTSSFLLKSKTWPWKINNCKKWSKVLFLTMSHSCPRRRWWQERGRRHSQHRSSDGIEALWKLKENSDAEYERSKISKYTILIKIDITNKMNFRFFVSFS